MPSNVPTASPSPSSVTRPHLEKFFEKADPVRARLIFAIDATASRQPTWDTAAKLTDQMFAAVAGDKLDVQLVYYRGGECNALSWMKDANSLSAAMAEISCEAGLTQIQRVLEHAKREHDRLKVAAVVLISDACEEQFVHLHGAACALKDVPIFTFQEGDDEHVAVAYKAIARLTGGAWARFEEGAAGRLADLLKAVVAFATGGVKALANQNSEAAKLLLTQLKK